MGRKAPTPLERYKTICWMKLVQQVSGKSAYMLEYELFPHLHGRKYWYYDRPRILEKYQVGKVVPTVEPYNLNSNVLKIDKLYPNTLWLFTHRFWRAVDPSPSLLKYIDFDFYELNKDIKTDLFCGRSSESPVGFPFKRAKLLKDDIDEIASEGTLGSFTVLMLLLNEAKLEGRMGMYWQVLYAFDDYYRLLVDIPYFFDEGENILAYVDSLHPYRYSSATGERVPVVRLSWKTGESCNFDEL